MRAERSAISRLFRNLDLDSSEGRQFCADLRALLDLERDSLQALVAELPSLLALDPRVQVRSRGALNALAEPSSQINQAINCLGFLAEQLLEVDDESDSVDNWAADLGSLLTQQGDREKFRAAAATLRSTRNVLLERSTAAGVLPCFAGLRTTVELRGIQCNTFAAGGDLARYQPDLRGTLPIISAHLYLDAGSTKDVYFQASLAQARALIDVLAAAVRDAEALESAILKR